MELKSQLDETQNKDDRKQMLIHWKDQLNSFSA